MCVPSQFAQAAQVVQGLLVSGLSSAALMPNFSQVPRVPRMPRILPVQQLAQLGQCTLDHSEMPFNVLQGSMGQQPFNITSVNAQLRVRCRSRHSISNK